MSPLLRSVLIALAVVAVSVPAAAQQASSNPPARQSQTVQPEWKGDVAAHFEGIALTGAQKAQILKLHADFHSRMDALRDSAKAAGAPTTGNPELQKRLSGLMAQEQAAFKALLDEAGRRRFDENMMKMHSGKHGAEHGMDHGAGHGSGRPPAR